MVGVYTLILNETYMSLSNRDLLDFPWYILAAILALTFVAVVVQMRYMRSAPDHPLNKKTAEAA